jgi:hypothetical protein
VGANAKELAAFAHERGYSQERLCTNLGGRLRAEHSEPFGGPHRTWGRTENLRSSRFPVPLPQGGHPRWLRTEEKDSHKRTKGSDNRTSRPNKINASTAYDLHGKHLTPYGGWLPVVRIKGATRIPVPGGTDPDLPADSPRHGSVPLPMGNRAGPLASSSAFRG